MKNLPICLILQLRKCLTAFVWVEIQGFFAALKISRSCGIP